ncbi:MAG TPA: PASTA domain-containing protein [Fervidobacterium sp.]|nr:PASTA domain-containing protein [Fervidobacterium sp.]HPT53669.1 PASTA domain-containing protein [Fervidobacterium sp.]HPZ17490.1 PASTA domain-containing protein [Fervidobacterium sp.]HQE48580.1 PASTA domain-containing protein [Fervidobacterium sp.]HUM42356.1 PASTA domain-containing protein [Fervidobacterium sp.]
MIDRRTDNRKSNKKKGKQSKVWLNLILIPVVIISAVLVGLLIFYGIMHVQARRGTYPLPNYVNENASTAREELVKLGFGVEIVGGDGRIIKMDPPGNTVVKLGRKVKLFTEGLVEKSMDLPEFKGAWYKSVQNVLKEVGVSTIIKKMDEPGIEGIVLSTAPTAGSKIKSGNVVTLFISSGYVVSRIDTKEEPKDTSLEVIPPAIEVESGTSSIDLIPATDINTPNYPLEDDNTLDEDDTDVQEDDVMGTDTIQGGQF